MTDEGGLDPRWAGRRRARAAALQVLYECEVGGLTVSEALGVLSHVGTPEAADLAEGDHEFAEALARGVYTDRAALDERIGQAARHWRVERMAALDRLVLRMAVHEWLALPATPPRVVINEAIELARAFSGEDAARFVNGVLDGVLKTLKDEGKVVE
ncbi:MAG: transcription antitermination factor NusB [Acidobacteria bacterium]|nr:transcription antitermination factor NusB [Acidobacteriota bacterium]